MEIADTDNSLIGKPVAAASQAERARFLRETYSHLAYAIIGFLALETLCSSRRWRR